MLIEFQTFLSKYSSLSPHPERKIFLSTSLYGQKDISLSISLSLSRSLSIPLFLSISSLSISLHFSFSTSLSLPPLVSPWVFNKCSLYSSLKLIYSIIALSLSHSTTF